MINHSCPKCGKITANVSNDTWGGVLRHITEFGCPKIGKKLSTEEAQQFINVAITDYLAAKDIEYQREEAYDRKHNLGAYSY